MEHSINNTFYSTFSGKLYASESLAMLISARLLMTTLLPLDLIWLSVNLLNSPKSTTKTLLNSLKLLTHNSTRLRHGVKVQEHSFMILC